MTNIVFKVIAYMFLFNISVGIMMSALPTVFTGPNTFGLTYDENQASTFNSSMQQIITPSGELEDAGNQVYRLLDLTIIGFIERTVSTLKHYLFGFITMLDRLLGQFMIYDNPGLYTFLFGKGFGALYIITGIAYIFGVLSLWTGKELTKG